MALADAELRGSLISNATLIDQMEDAPHWFTFMSMISLTKVDM